MSRSIYSTAARVRAAILLLATLSLSAVSSANATTLVMTSNPQYPWADGCPGCNGTDIGGKNVMAQYNSINAYHATKPVDGIFINGDLTAFGHGWQISWMKGALNTLKPTYYLGLGNHDYENNVDDCFANACAIASTSWFVSSVQARGVNRFDYHKMQRLVFPVIRNEHSGSLAYSKSFGKVHVIQLNNHPDYETDFAGFTADGLTSNSYTIKSSMRWLEQELSWARRNGCQIIIAMHKPYFNSQLRSLLDRYSVAAVFVGHYPAALGFNGMQGNTPVFFTGSASYKSYLIVEASDAQRNFKIYSVEDNAPGAKMLVYNQTYRDQVASLPPQIFTSPTVVKATNNGDYTTDVRISHHAPDGRDIRFWPGNKALGQQHMFTVPAGASNIRLHGEKMTGLFWAPWGKIFDEPIVEGDHCAKVWDTVFSSNYSLSRCGNSPQPQQESFINLTNRICLDVRGGLNAGSPLITWPCHGGSN